MAVHLPKWKLDCRTCTRVQKLERGCIQDSLIPEAWELDDWKFSRCPKKVVTRQSYEFILAYNFYKGGFLPNPGGWMQQPVKFIEAVMLIDGMEGEDKKK